MRTLLGFSLSFLCFAAVAAGSSSGGEVYRWVDSNGVVHYSDKPQAPNDKPVNLPNLQTYKPGGAPPGFTSTTVPVQSTDAGASISITAPKPDETIRDAEGKFTVSVNTNLQSGAGLVYYLDGTALNTQPTPSTAYLYTAVERGEHSVSVALIGTDGRERARSAAVTIYMKPPAARR